MASLLIRGHVEAHETKSVKDILVYNIYRDLHGTFMQRSQRKDEGLHIPFSKYSQSAPWEANRLHAPCGDFAPPLAIRNFGTNPRQDSLCCEIWSKTMQQYATPGIPESCCIERRHASQDHVSSESRVLTVSTSLFLYGSSSLIEKGRCPRHHFGHSHFELWTPRRRRFGMRRPGDVEGFLAEARRGE